MYTGARNVMFGLQSWCVTAFYVALMVNVGIKELEPLLEREGGLQYLLIALEHYTKQPEPPPGDKWL